MINKHLFFHELIHLLPAIPISLFIYWRFRSLRPVLAVFLATYLIDLDHLFDYYYFSGGFNFEQFLNGVDFFDGSQKVFVLAHSWELATLLVFWGWLKQQGIILAVGLAIFGHLLVDQLTYTPYILGYFLTFRWLNNFDLIVFSGDH